MLINVAFPVFAPTPEWDKRFDVTDYDFDRTVQELGSPYLSNQNKQVKVQDGVYYTDLNPDIWFERVGLDVYPSFDRGYDDARDLCAHRKEKNLPFIPMTDIARMIRLSMFGDADHTEHGVCDNVSQILAKWPHLMHSSQRHFITLTPIRKEEQPEFGGWRWHKWGPYIGDHEPQYEYLYDEEGIEVVYVFRIYTLKPHSGYGRASMDITG